MAKNLIVEHDDERIGFFKPNPNEFKMETEIQIIDGEKVEVETVRQTEVDYLVIVEANWNKEGIITHGTIEDDDIPASGHRMDLQWDGKQLVFNPKKTWAKLSKRAERNRELAKWDTTAEVYNRINHTDLQIVLNYQQTLRDHGVVIDADPDNAVLPIDNTGVTSIL